MEKLNSQELMIGAFVYNEESDLCMVVSLCAALTDNYPERISVWNFKTNNMEMDTSVYGIPIEYSIYHFIVDCHIERAEEDSIDHNGFIHDTCDVVHYHDELRDMLSVGYTIYGYSICGCFFNKDWEQEEVNNYSEMKYVHQCQMYSRSIAKLGEKDPCTIQMLMKSIMGK